MRDYLVVGTGLAGLSAALYAAQHGNVTLVSKYSVTEGNSSRAQGGIAVVSSSSDSIETHIQDTLNAGAGLCHIPTVENFIAQGPERAQDLSNWGVQFDKSGNENDLTREAAHSERRILHVKDQTGKAIHSALLEQVRLKSNIKLENHLFLIDLITNRRIKSYDSEFIECYGGYFYNQKTKEVISLLAQHTLLATGGAGRTYLYTSNWPGATGDGIAAAYRAGASVANMEFTQFHPTCLYHRDERNFLISEALRGEGGILVNSNGKDFTKEFHSAGSLAPRDVVARAIDSEIKRTGEKCVYLDVTHLNKEKLIHHFPEIYKKCKSLGIDLTSQPIPVVPAAHYICGGILTNANGQSGIQRLYAIGETACNGFHGANRLASNSLLECLASASNAIKDTLNTPPSTLDLRVPKWEYTNSQNEDELAVIHHIWDEIRTLMWNYVGIIRTNKRLQRAKSRLENIQSEISEYYWDFQLSPEILELRNIAQVADLIVTSSLTRKESRGTHFNLDYPEKAQSNSKPTVV